MPAKPIEPVLPDPPTPVEAAPPGGKTALGPIEPEEFTPDENLTGWIEIELVDEAGQPVAGEPFRVELPDGRVARGSLDELGLARVEGIPSGACRVTFPRRDGEAFETL